MHKPKQDRVQRQQAERNERFERHRQKEARRKREVCNGLLFWSLCRNGSCRRQRACGGEPFSCFERHWAMVSEDTKVWIRAIVLAMKDGRTLGEAIDVADVERAQYLAQQAQHATADAAHTATGAPAAGAALAPDPAALSRAPRAPRLRGL